MEDPGGGLENYFKKINSFVACLKSRTWIPGANYKAVKAVVDTAIDIEDTLSKDRSGKLRDVLEVVYPEYDFDDSVNLVMKIILNHPELKEDVRTNILEAYPDKLNVNNSDDELETLAVCLMKELMCNETAVKLFKAQERLLLWEEMIADNNDNFENVVKETLEKDVLDVLEVFEICSLTTGHIILIIVLSCLENDSDLKLWFSLLHSEKIEITLKLCHKYSDLLKELLNFLSRYAEGADSDDVTFIWTHKLYPVTQFADIVNVLLKDNGKVGIAVNKYINEEINKLENNFAFWIYVKNLCS